MAVDGWWDYCVIYKSKREKIAISSGFYLTYIKYTIYVLLSDILLLLTSVSSKLIKHFGQENSRISYKLFLFSAILKHNGTKY